MILRRDRRIHRPRSGRRAPAHRAIAALALAALLPLAAAGRAAAQSVVGTAADAGTGQPLAGVFIQLLDGEGRAVAGVLSRADGSYRLAAPESGIYRIAAAMIGYATVRSAPFDVPRGPAVRHPLPMTVEAIQLGGIEVRADDRCRLGPDAGPETARVWQEASKALEVASWGQRTEAVRFRVRQHSREIDARSREVLDEQWDARAVMRTSSPFRSLPAAELNDEGYVRPAADGSLDFFAPDADVLLSEAFLDTHCFTVSPPPGDEPDLIGLAFRPAPDRALPDIRGVLWLDRETAALRRLDFTYTALPLTEPEFPGIGGRVEFERLGGGLWIVRRWHIRMPLEIRRRRGQPVLTRLLEVGGEVWGEGEHGPGGES